MLKGITTAHIQQHRLTSHVSTASTLPPCLLPCISPDHSHQRHRHIQHHRQTQHQQPHRHGSALSASAAAPPEAAMPVLFTTLLLAAALPVVKALLMSCVGAYAAVKGILTLEGRRTVSGLIIQVFLPCYFFSNLAMGVSLTDAVRLWPITINMLLTHVLGFSLGWVVVKVIQPPVDFRRHVTVANAVGNTGNYPLVLIASLASDPSLTLFSGLQNPDLLGIQYIVLGSFIASLIQFPVIFGMLKTGKDTEAAAATAAAAAAVPQLQIQIAQPQDQHQPAAPHLEAVTETARDEVLPLLSSPIMVHVELQVITHPERLQKIVSMASISDQLATDNDSEPLLSSPSDACSSSSIPHSHHNSPPAYPGPPTTAHISAPVRSGQLLNDGKLQNSSSLEAGVSLPHPSSSTLENGKSSEDNTQSESPVRRVMNHVQATAARCTGGLHAAMPSALQEALRWCAALWKRHKPLIDSILTVPVYACMLGLLFGSIPALRDLMFARSGALFLVGDVINTFGALTIPCLFLVLGANLSKGPGISKLPPKLFISLIISRQVLMPLMGTAMVMGAYSTGMLGVLDPMALMVMLIIHSTPTALMVHSIATQLRSREDDVSAVLFWSYLASIITLPACISSYLYIVTRATAATVSLAV